jgi:hypothetical protein
MRKLLCALITVSALAMALVASAQAYEAGWTLYYTGYPTPNSHVHIYNNTTGASGGTYSDANGYYQFNGLTYSYSYTIWACSSNSQYESPHRTFTYPGYNIRIDLTESNYVGFCT